MDIKFNNKCGWFYDDSGQLADLLDGKDPEAIADVEDGCCPGGYDTDGSLVSEIFMFGAAMGMKMIHDGRPRLLMVGIPHGSPYYEIMHFFLFYNDPGTVRARLEALPDKLPDVGTSP